MGLAPYGARDARLLALLRRLYAVLDGDRVPAVVHVDGTGRLQSVTAQRNPRFHALLAEFHRLTGVPILLNTSFNIMGKPILHSAEDAVLMFHTTGLDAVVIDDWLLVKDPVHLAA